MRSIIARTPAALVIAAALGSAWLLQRHVRRQSSGADAGACLHVIATHADGRLAWVMSEGDKRVKRGDIVARLQAEAPGQGLRSPVGGAIRAVIRKPGDAVRRGDPLIVVGPWGRGVCP